MITSFPVFIPGEGGAFLFPSPFQKKMPDRRLYWWRRFWRFSEDFPPLSEDFQNCSESPNIFRTFSKIAEAFEEDPKMFRLYTKEFKYNLRDKLDICEIIDITSEDVENTPLESRM